MKSYVYVFLDPRKFGEFSYAHLYFNYEPFYVGKGKGKRDSSFCRGRLVKSKMKAIRKSGESPISVRIYNNISDKDSLVKEIRTIKLIGRRDLGEGPLLNLTDGGDGGAKRIWTTEERKVQSEITKERHKLGTFGQKGKKYSEETKCRMSRASKGKSKSKKHKENIKKGRWTDEARKVQSEKAKELHKLGKFGMKGKKHSEETKQKMSEVSKGVLKSEEHRENIRKNHARPNLGKKWSWFDRSNSRKGVKLTEEHKEKISASLKGRTLSEKTKEKISNTLKMKHNPERRVTRCAY